MLARSIPDPLGAATARAGRDASPVFNVPLFRSLIDRLDEDHRAVVLDLGSAKPATVGLLSRFRCRLDIADLDCNASGHAAEPDVHGIGNLLPDAHEEPTDVVLCWDYLNYFDRASLKALMECIAYRCREGARVHALMSYSDTLMQAQPGRFSPIDAGQFRDDSDSEPTRPAPRYTAEDLGALLPLFRVDRACLLRNGMQEYLFYI